METLSVVEKKSWESEHLDFSLSSAGNLLCDPFPFWVSVSSSILCEE